MKIQKHLAVGILVIFAACSGNNAKMNGIGNGFSVDAPLPADNPFRLQPANTIIQFLRWYRNNVKEIKQIQLLTHSSNPDSSQYLVVNMPATEQYLAKLQSSGFVSDKYVDMWRRYFKSMDDDLRKNPQTNTPVKGLDVDFIMWAKDFDDDLAKIEKSTVEYQSVVSNQATIVIGLPTVGRIKYRIGKEGNKWQISEIKDLRTALDQPEND
jgi:hypothetical protein